MRISLIVTPKPHANRRYAFGQCASRLPGTLRITGNLALSSCAARRSYMIMKEKQRIRGESFAGGKSFAIMAPVSPGAMP
jgi:hypothetical protein